MPLGEYKTNMRKIIAMTCSNFGENMGIILISPLVCHDGCLWFQRVAYGDRVTEKLERMLKLLGAYTRGTVRVAYKMGTPSLIYGQGCTNERIGVISCPVEFTSVLWGMNLWKGRC